MTHNATQAVYDVTFQDPHVVMAPGNTTSALYQTLAPAQPEYYMEHEPMTLYVNFDWIPNILTTTTAPIQHLGPGSHIAPPPFSFPEHLEQFYTFRNRQEVLAFVRQYPHLLQVLDDARPHLLEHFGPQAEFVLEAFRDYEIRDWVQLFVCARVDMPVKEGLARLDAIDYAWFLDQTDRVDDLLVIDVECL